MSATTVSQLAPLQDALAAAVRASLPLAADARLPFVRRHLRATIDGTPLPIAEGERAGPPAALTAELNELSKLLTKVVNGARDKPGWPMSAVADALDTMAEPTAAKAPAVAAGAAVEQEPPASEKKKKGVAIAAPNVIDPFRVSVNGMVRQKTMRELIAPEVLELRDSPEKSEQDEHVRHVAKLAFEMFDKDNSGTIDKEELFSALIDLGRVAPSGADEAGKREYLETNFKIADTNGDVTRARALALMQGSLMPCDVPLTLGVCCHQHRHHRVRVRVLPAPRA